MNLNKENMKEIVNNIKNIIKNDNYELSIRILIGHVRGKELLGIVKNIIIENNIIKIEYNNKSETKELIIPERTIVGIDDAIYQRITFTFINENDDLVLYTITKKKG